MDRNTFRAEDWFLKGIQCRTPRNDSSCEKKCCYVVGIFIQLLKPCGAIHNLAYSGFRTPITVFPYVQLFVHPLPFVLRRIDRPLYQLLSDCASG